MTVLKLITVYSTHSLHLRNPNITKTSWKLFLWNKYYRLPETHQQTILVYDPALPLPDTYSGEIKTYVRVKTCRESITVLFWMTKNRKTVNGYTNCCTSKLWHALSAIKEEATTQKLRWSHRGTMPQVKGAVSHSKETHRHTATPPHKGDTPPHHHTKRTHRHTATQRGHTATPPHTRHLPRGRGWAMEGGPDYKKGGTRSTFGETEYPRTQTSGSHSGSSSTWTSSRITRALSWTWNTAGFSCLKYRSPGNTDQVRLTLSATGHYLLL